MYCIQKTFWSFYPFRLKEDTSSHQVWQNRIHHRHNTSWATAASTPILRMHRDIVSHSVVSIYNRNGALEASLDAFPIRGVKIWCLHRFVTPCFEYGRLLSHRSSETNTVYSEEWKRGATVCEMHQKKGKILVCSQSVLVCLFYLIFMDEWRQDKTNGMF